MKKDIELDCLQAVIKYGKKQRSLTKKIVKLLDGEDVSREDSERPDFIRLSRSYTKNQENIMIGIEHFRVDHLSVQKQDFKVGSAGIIHQKAVSSMFSKWHNKVKSKLPTEAIGDLVEVMANQFERIRNASYKTFLAAFSYSLHNHLKSVMTYKDNIKKCSTCSTHKSQMVFLIEIHTDFSELLLNDKKGVHKNASGCMPMFADVVNILEAIEPDKVDYIVLFLRSFASVNTNQVIAVKTGNVRIQLEKQHIKIYEYAGDDLLLPPFQSMQADLKVESSFDVDGDKTNILFTTLQRDMLPEYRMDLLFYSSKVAFDAIRKGLNFATTVSVQMVVEVYCEYIAGWEYISEKERWKVRPVFTFNMPSSLEPQIQSFEQRYFPNKENVVT